MEKFEPYILLIISGQGFLLSSALLAGIFKKRYANFFLGLITAVITIEIFTIWVMRMNLNNSPSTFPIWLLGSYLIIPPALWFFMKSNLNPTFQLKRIQLWLFVPALIEIVVEGFSYFSNWHQSSNYHPFDNPFWFFFTEILPVVAMGVVIIFLSIDLYRLQNNVKQSLNGLYKLYAFLGFFSLTTFFWALEAFYIVPVFKIIEVILVLFVFILGYLGYFKPSFLDIPKLAKQGLVNQNFPQFNDEKELGRLRSLFDHNKIHTQQKLSLKQVADSLKLPERYVSALINLHHNTNFNSFVNGYRVSEAISRIQDPGQRKKNLLGIAMDSGFNSKSSFNQIFKEVTGKNPSDYLKK
ncbi:hypothetical protein MTsPCn5_25150 [Croceitalea sp. MTPC5]|uniref:helix-turn-helix domain-containing protein n=1 Tax=Croceitalea sp. MTPC5 TaxID=3056565 RepID=UPI002B3E3192|nr:hypothetical protein MTsPCn5_25150 [Croceitalea sp. MTPC5]